MTKKDPLEDTQIVDVSTSLDEDAVSSMLDRIVEGRYRIKRRLARGGMGVVYLAEHTTLGRLVVFKVLSYHLANDERAKSRFEREARGLSVLDHPNIVTVHDFGLEESLTYIVMEYVDGENLSQRVRRKGRIVYDELLPMAMQTIDAIAAAHEKNIIHRDIKPSNVMVTNKAGRPDFVKVLDFGLAKLATTSIDLTKGNLVGTVSYLAPEVIKGADASAASDVYSLGVMLYYLLAGSKPFQASDDMSVLYQHVNVEPDWIGEIVPEGEAPHEFLRFIHQCMEKDPARRPGSALEMRQLLGELVSLPSISAFSIDSSQAIPRYTPDSDAEGVRRPPRDTRPPRQLAPPPAASGSEARESQPSLSSRSFARARPRHSVRVMAIAFTSFSIGVLILAFVLKQNQEEPAGAPTEAEPTEAVEATGSRTAAVEASARLQVRTTPEGAVSADGEPHGRSPLELELTPGPHVISVSEPGYTTWTQTVDVEAGERHRIDVFLTGEGSTDEAQVKIDGDDATPRPTAAAQRTPDVQRPEPPPPKQPAELPSPDAGSQAEEPPSRPTGGGLLPTDDQRGGLLPVDD